jgi:hypothetical protein
MGLLSLEFKKRVAEIYQKNVTQLEKLDPNTMETFAIEILETIDNEKKKSEAIHDLEILEYNMKLLKKYSTALKQYTQDTDEYDFTQNDCKNLVDSTKRWLKLERLL